MSKHPGLYPIMRRRRVPFKEIEDAVLGPVPEKKPEPVMVVDKIIEGAAEVNAQAPAAPVVESAPIEVQERILTKPEAAVQVPKGMKPRK